MFSCSLIGSDEDVFEVGDELSSQGGMFQGEIDSTEWCRDSPSSLTIVQGNRSVTSEPKVKGRCLIGQSALGFGFNIIFNRLATSIIPPKYSTLNPRIEMLPMNDSNNALDPIKIASNHIVHLKIIDNSGVSVITSRQDLEHFLLTTLIDTGFINDEEFLFTKKHSKLVKTLKENLLKVAVFTSSNEFSQFYRQLSGLPNGKWLVLCWQTLTRFSLDLDDSLPPLSPSSSSSSSSSSNSSTNSTVEEQSYKSLFRASFLFELDRLSSFRTPINGGSCASDKFYFRFFESFGTHIILSESYGGMVLGKELINTCPTHRRDCGAKMSDRRLSEMRSRIELESYSQCIESLGSGEKVTPLTHWGVNETLSVPGVRLFTSQGGKTSLCSNHICDWKAFSDSVAPLPVPFKRRVKLLHEFLDDKGILLEDDYNCFAKAYNRYIYTFGMRKVQAGTRDKSCPCIKEPPTGPRPGYQRAAQLFAIALFWGALGFGAIIILIFFILVSILSTSKDIGVREQGGFRGQNQ